MNAADLAGQKVHAYRNLVRARRGRPPVWSVRAGGRVVGHVSEIVLAEVSLRVQAGGRRRARETGHRNVHAYVAGTVAEAPSGLAWVPVGYDPFGPATFTLPDATPVTTAPWVRLGPNGCHAAW